MTDQRETELRAELNARNVTIGRDTAAEVRRKKRTSKENFEVAPPVDPLEARIDFWCEWGVFEVYGATDEGYTLQKERTEAETQIQGEYDYLQPWGEACHEWCEAQWRSLPADRRPSRKTLKIVFGPYGPAHAHKMLKQMDVNRRAKIMALLKTGIGKPKQRRIEKLGTRDDAYSVADTVSAEIDAKFARRGGFVLV